MAIARHEHGLQADLRALLSQVHPVFMLPPLAASWFGAAVAGEFALSVGAIHMTAIFFAVYTAHVKDGYVDFHRRGEDDDHPMTIRGCRLPSRRRRRLRRLYAHARVFVGPGAPRSSPFRPGSSGISTRHSSIRIRSPRRWGTRAASRSRCSAGSTSRRPR